MEGEFRVNNLLNPSRLDVFLAEKFGISRNQIQNLIGEGKILLNGKKVKKNIKVKEDDLIEIIVPLTFDQKIKAENIPLDIIYQDDDIIVLNKRAGMVVHPTSKIKTGTLANALLFHSRSLSSVGGDQRPGLVHRLDRDTSGVMVVAKTDSAHFSLAGQFKNRTVRKKYIALVNGEVKKESRIETFFGRHPRAREKMSTWGGLDKGKKAVTEVKILERFKGFTLLEVYPRTGRTHQIRVHMSSIGHPVAGDRVYGGKIVSSVPPNKIGGHGKCQELRVNRQMLHAQSIGFLHPRTGKYVEFSVPIPEDMQKVIDDVRK